MRRALPRHRWLPFAVLMMVGLVAAAMAPRSASAQEGTTSGSLVGTVVNPDGSPAANVRIVVTDIDRGTTREILTDEDGRFLVPLLPPASYRVRAIKPPQPPTEVSPVVINVGERQSLRLELRPVEVEEVGVQVRREATVAQGGVSSLVGEEQIESLPTPGRDFTDFIELSGFVSPQPDQTTGGQFAIGGAKTTATNLQVDGADANNTFFGENRGSSRVPFTFSLESIKEFQVITNGFDVEYGRYSGGVVNAVTKSGSNEFKGSAHLFFRDAELTSDGFLGESPKTFQAFQFGGVFSGPIVKDELHFLVSGDFQLWDQPAFAFTPERSNLSPSTVDRLASALSSLGIQDPRQDFGRFTETEDQSNLFARLDWSINPDHRLTLRANYSDFKTRNDGIGQSGLAARTTGSTFNDEALSLVAELNSTLGENLYNTFRIQYSDEDRPRFGNSQLPLMVLEDVETTEGNERNLDYGGNVVDFNSSNVLRESKVQITNNLIWDLGDHTLKFGTDNIFSDTFNKVWLLGNGVALYNPTFLFEDGIEALRAETPFIFFRLVPDGAPAQPPTGEFQNQDWSVYAQDAWQVSDRLLLTLGLRYDWKVFDDRAVPLADAGDRSLLRDQFGVSMETVPEDRNNVSPRVSFRYDAEGDDSTVLSGGAGIFFGRFPNVLHGNVLQSTPHPRRFMFSLGKGVPAFDVSEMQDDLSAIPSDCSRGSDIYTFGFCDPGEPQIPVWSADMQQPTTYKANLGIEHQVSEDWRVSLEGVYSQTENNYSVTDVNLNEPQFTNEEGRPVHVARDDYDPSSSGALRFSRSKNPSLDRVMVQDSRGKFRAWNVNAEVQGRPAENLQLSASYTLNVAKDNSSYVCCSAFAFLEDTQTWGDFNELGGFGDEDQGNWGPSNFERRHVFVANGIWRLPADFTVSFIYRAQAGNPFTPIVDGDLNGDGIAENDRAYLPDPDELSGAMLAEVNDDGQIVNAGEQLEKYRSVLENNECIREHVGTIMPRNRCRNPWFHRVDLKFTKSFQTVSGHRAELILDLFNALDGLDNLLDLNWDATEFVTRDRFLFRAEGTADDGRVVYSVNDNFGQKRTFFRPFQFQAQLGLKYHF